MLLFLLKKREIDDNIGNRKKLYLEEVKGIRMNKVMEEIKYAVAKFIERRLIVSRELQVLSYGEDNLFDVDCFITLALQYDNLLKDLYLRHQKGMDITIIKNDERLSMLEATKALKYNLQSEKIWKAKLTDDNIKDIVSLLYRYFDIIDFNSFRKKRENYNENAFLRDVLEYIRNNDEKNYADLANRYLEYFSARATVGFNNAISGCISIGYLDLIVLSNGEGIKVFEVTNDDKVTIPYDENNDYFLKADEIIFGYTLINGEKVLMPVRKIDDRKYYAFIYGKQIFAEDEEVNDAKIVPYKSLKTILEEKGLTEYYQDVYGNYDFMRLLNLISNCENDLSIFKGDMYLLDEEVIKKVL